MAEFNFPSTGQMKRPNEVPDKPKEPAQVKAVAKGQIKKTKWQEFMSDFFEEDITNVKDYVLKNAKRVLIKGTKDLIFESIRIFLYPGSRGGGGGGAKRSFRSYDSYYEDDRSPVRSLNKPQRVTYTTFDTSVICFDDPKEAQDVLNQMVEYLTTYGQVSVARCYDFSGLTPPNTANKFGWTSLNGAEVSVTPDGYGLRLPRPQPL